MKKIITVLCLSSVLFIIVLNNCMNKLENFVVSTDGVNIRFYDQGKGEPSLVFVHGFASDHWDWEFQATYFSMKQRVVVIELAGFGASGNNRENWTMGMFGEDVASVIEYLDLDKVVLVGQSMGGAVILEAAKRVPEKLVGLVPVDMFQNVERKYPTENLNQRIKDLMERVRNPDRERLRAAFKREIDPVIIDRIIHCHESSPKIGWEASIRDLGRWLNQDLIPTLQAVRLPITCINSDNQATNIDIGRKYTPLFDAVVIQNTGHAVMLDAPDEFNSALEKIIKKFTDPE